MTTEKKNEYFKEAIKPEELGLIRDALRMASEGSATAKAREIRTQFPQWSPKTLEDYARMALGSTDLVFGFYLEGKVSIMALSLLARFEFEDQAFMVKEYIDQKMTPDHLRKIRRIKKEQGCGFAEAIAKAMGEMPMHQPREQKPRSFDTLLDDITKASMRWRGMMSLAFDLIGEEEAKAGVHAGLFQKAYLLRHVIKENYDFANSKVNRYFNFIKKKYRAQAEMSSVGPEFTETGMEGEPNGDSAGAGEKGVDREAGAHDQDGPSLPDQSGESEGEGRIQ